MVTITHGPPPLTRFVLVGDGATTASLTWSLSRHYGCVASIPSFVRAYAEWANRRMTFNDLGAIARVQLALEDEHMVRAQYLVFQDNDLLAITAFAHHYFGHCAEWIEAEVSRRRPAAYLLCHPTSRQLELPDRGEEQPLQVHDRLADAIAASGAPCLEITGPFADRPALAVTLVDRFLGL
jgi:nicotinamide riboside kinase